MAGGLGDVPPDEELVLLRQKVAGLELAVQSREVIGMAKGIIMARGNCGPEEAFQVLARASQRENRKLVEVAKSVVNEQAIRAGRKSRRKGAQQP